MAGKLWISRIERAKSLGYKVISIFVVVDTVELSIARIAKRVQEGGHSIPERTVRRRWRRCHANFMKTYKEASDSWYIFDNSTDGSCLVAQKTNSGEQILNAKILERLEQYAR
jgi:predicted ABC-type ATPase